MPTNTELDEQPLQAPEEVPADDLLEELLPVPDEDTQRELFAAVVGDHNDAITDRQPWEQNLELWEEQYLGILPDKSEPWPGCFTPGTDLLTRSGWVPVQNIKAGMEVLSLNPASREAAFQVVQATQRRESTPFSVRLHQPRGIDITVTPEHRVLMVSRRNNKHCFEAANTLVGLKKHHWSIPLAATPVEGVLPAMPKGVTPHDWFELWGWYLSEGWWDRANNSAIYIAQSATANPKKCRRIERLLDRLPFKWSFAHNRFYVSVGPYWRVAFAACGIGAEDKRIPEAVMDAPSDCLRAFIDAFWLGDGSVDAKGRRVCGLGSLSLADDIQAVLARLGEVATVHEQVRPDGQRVIVIYRKRRQTANCEWIQTERVDYTGENWCVSVSWGTVYARQNGVALFIGQCANFNVPLTMLGIETLKPRLVEAVLGGDPIVYVRPTEATSEEQADRTELFLNWQLRTEIDVVPQVEESAHTFLNPGIVVAKILWRRDLRRVKAVRMFPAATQMQDIFRDLFGDDLPEEWTPKGETRWEGFFRDPGGAKREVKVRFKFTAEEIHVLLDKEQVTFDAPRVELLAPEDFTAPFRGGADVQRLPWCDQNLWLTEDDLRRKVQAGRFYETETKMLLGEIPTEETDPLHAQELQDLRSSSEGAPDPVTSVKQDQYHVIEGYRRWDMDDDGFEEEVIVWASPQLPGRILGWDYLDNVVAHGRRPFVVGRYLKLPQRFYGLSFPEVVRDVQDEINTMHNQRVDAGTIANTPMGFFRASMTTPPGPMRVKPGDWISVDNPQTDVNIPRWPVNTVFGQNEEALLYQYFERLTGLTDLSLGRQPNRVGATRTASGTAALLSEAGLRFKTSMEAFQRFWVEVFEHILALDQQHLPPGKEFRVTGRLPEVIRLEDRQAIAGKFRLRLSATTETMNKQVLREDATTKLNAALQSPFPFQFGILGVKGLRRLYRNFFQAWGEQDPEMVLEPLQQPVVHTPEEELAIWNSGGDVEPSILENITQHLTSHDEQLTYPEVQSRPELVTKILQHKMKTMQVAQMQAMATMMQQGGGRRNGKPVAGQQVENKQTGQQAPQQPAGFGGGTQQ